MSKELPFMIYCLEEYISAKNMQASDVADLFKKNSVFAYISEFYEALHTTGAKYIVNDIDMYIRAQN